VAAAFGAFELPFVIQKIKNVEQFLAIKAGLWCF
jgi:hypothetical protein